MWVHSRLPKTLVLFKTKNLRIPQPMYDLTKTSIPYLRPALCQTCLIIRSLVKTDVESNFLFFFFY